MSTVYLRWNYNILSTTMNIITTTTTATIDIPIAVLLTLRERKKMMKSWGTVDEQEAWRRLARREKKVEEKSCSQSMCGCNFHHFLFAVLCILKIYYIWMVVFFSNKRSSVNPFFCSCSSEVCSVFYFFFSIPSTVFFLS